jgi:hypothetical protein
MGKRKQRASKRTESGINSKQWNDEFFKNRIVADRPYLVDLEAMDSRRDVVSALLQQPSSSAPSLQVERALEFFSDAQSRDDIRLPHERAWAHTLVEPDEPLHGYSRRVTCIELNESLEHLVSTQHPLQNFNILCLTEVHLNPTADYQSPTNVSL